MKRYIWAYESKTQLPKLREMARTMLEIFEPFGMSVRSQQSRIANNEIEIIFCHMNDHRTFTGLRADEVFLFKDIEGAMEKHSQEIDKYKTLKLCEVAGRMDYGTKDNSGM